MKAKVFVLLGGLVGPDGYVMNPGLYSLASRIAKLSNDIQVSTHVWSDWQKVAKEITQTKLPTKVILVGFSGGGSRSTYIQNNVAMAPIDLIIGYDPSPVWQCLPIRMNVKRAICYHNNMPLMFGLGGGKFVGPQVETVEFSQQHMLVQFNESLHQRTLREIAKEIGNANLQQA